VSNFELGWVGSVTALSCEVIKRVKVEAKPLGSQPIAAQLNQNRAAIDLLAMIFVLSLRRSLEVPTVPALFCRS